MARSQAQGFILIIVVGMLGSLAFMGLSYTRLVGTTKTLSEYGKKRSQVNLMLRSGVEKGFSESQSRVSNGLLEPGTNRLAIFDGLETSWAFALPLSAPNETKVSLKDSSGCLNINDGIIAGIAELGSSYEADALDPWPESLKIYDMDPPGSVSLLTGVITDPNGGFTQDLKDEYVYISQGSGNSGFSRIVDVIDDENIRVHPVLVDSTGYEIIRTDKSALANLRIRRLLNAYGDVHRRIADLGWPTWSGDPTSDPTWNHPTTFTSTATEDRPHAMPGGNGLGDVIIRSRPQGGYRHLTEIRDIVNEWGQEQLLEVDEDYLEGETFFEKIRFDLTLDSYHDTEFHKMNREFGVYKTRTSNSIAVRELMHLEDELIDFEGLWQKHPVSLINLNAASLEVFAATCYAPVNVSFSYQSGRVDGVNLFDHSNSPTSMFKNLSPGIVPTSPLFRGGNAQTSQVKENGRLDFVQGNRLMSLRDAMVLAQGYKYYGEADGYPDSFTAFAAHLKKLQMGDTSHPVLQDYERSLEDKNADNFIPHYPKDELISHEQNPGDTPLSIPNGHGHGQHPGQEHDHDSFFFRQTYIEKSLPHLFSSVRRLPSWMNAPLALTSPYLRPEQVQNNRFGLYSVEDFVFRFHLPKVCFVSCGVFKTRVLATVDFGNELLEDELTVDFKSFETKFFRAQSDFSEMLDGAHLDGRFKIGPELLTTSIHPLGVIGLNDRRAYPSESHPYGAIHNFDEYSPSDNYSPGLFLGSEQLLPEDTLFPRINSEDEYYLGQTFTMIHHQYSEPYASNGWQPNDNLPAFHAFDPNFIDALRNPPLESNITWRRLRPVGIIGSRIRLRLFQLTGSTSYLAMQDPNNFISAIAPLWNTTLGASGPPPATGIGWDGIAWEMCKHSSSTGIYWRNEADPLNSIVEESWTNGVPGLRVNNESDMGNSNMRGAEASVFASGSLATSLSSFNGLSFSSMGHGLRANKKFSNSFLFRPYALIDPDYLGGGNGGSPDIIPENNVATANQFNRGMISFWFKVPSGHQYGDRCLFHLNLWEDVEQGTSISHDPTTTENQVRSNQIYAYLEPDYEDTKLFVGHVSISRQQDLVTWSDDIDLVNVPYPAQPTVQNQNYNYLGVPYTHNNMNVDSIDPVGRWFHSHTNVEGYKMGNFVAGQWYRLIVGWDYKQLHLDVRHRFWAKIMARAQTQTKNYAHKEKDIKRLASYNKQMLLSFGEMPLNLVNHLDMQSGAAFHPSALEEFRSYPFMRLNSSIDNIDIRFGHTLGNNDWFGFPIQLPVSADSVSSYLEDSDSRTIRYDINSLNSTHPSAMGYTPEPKLVLDISRKVKSSGGLAKVISVGSRIYDVPFGSLFNRSSKVEIDIEGPLGTLAASIYESNQETSGDLFQKRGQVNTHSSKSLKTFLNNDQNYVNLGGLATRMALTYKAESPKGDPINLTDCTLSNIPWIKEISVRYRVSAQSTIKKWDNIN